MLKRYGIINQYQKNKEEKILMKDTNNPEIVKINSIRNLAHASYKLNTPEIVIRWHISSVSTSKSLLGKKLIDTFQRITGLKINQNQHFWDLVKYQRIL